MRTATATAATKRTATRPIAFPWLVGSLTRTKPRPSPGHQSCLGMITAPAVPAPSRPTGAGEACYMGPRRSTAGVVDDGVESAAREEYTHVVASRSSPRIRRHAGGSGLRGRGRRAAGEPRADRPLLSSVRLPHSGTPRSLVPADARWVRRAQPPLQSGRLPRAAGLDGLPCGRPRAGRDARVRRSVPRGGPIGAELPLHLRGSRAPRGAGAAPRGDLQGGDLAVVGYLTGGRPRRDHLRRDRGGLGRASLDRTRLRNLVGKGCNGRAALAREVNFRCLPLSPSLM